MRSRFTTFMLSLLLAAPAMAHTQREVLDAIQQVESGGRKHPPRGDSGRARGSFQIWEPYFRDSGVKGQWSDCDDAEFSRRVVIGYAKRYEPAALANCDARALAMLHHYGPSWRDRNDDPHHYWAKVEAQLEKSYAHI